jgi:hypothetical protein
MKTHSILAGVVAALLLTTPAAAQAPVPGIGEILDRRQELGLSSGQVEQLERLSLDVTRETIRRQAELMLAQVDLAALLNADPGQPVDLARTEAKLREIERIRTDWQLALLRADETAKAGLTPEQRTKLTAMPAGAALALDPPPTESETPARPSPRGQSGPVILTRGTGQAPPGGGAGRPPAPAPPHVQRPHPSPAPPRAPAPHFNRGPQVRVFVGPWFGWWDPYWSYPPPVIVPGPPVYSVPPPQAYWYYCPSLGAYYPYVPSCPEPWVPVPSA